MKAPLSLILMSSIVLFSCKKEEETISTNEKTNVVPFTQMNTATSNATPQATSSNTAYVGKEEKKESVMYQYKYEYKAVPNPNANKQTVVTPKGMNPPHGQPLHRCDIPVGAPLTSKPAKTQKVTTTQPVVSTSSTPTPSVNSTNSNVPALLATPEPTPEGMNPPHGQPKHRCDIAVGAPLPKE